MEILKDTNFAVFGYNDKMCEVAVHNKWAKTILKRAKIYGVIE